MGRLGVTEILVILAIVLLLLVVKIPELMGLGSGIKEFKTLLKTVNQLIKRRNKIKGFS
jgi:sec-independent protein translocase protein TatA